MGNPSGAVADKNKPDNFLVKKRQYALSYNNSKGTPNWVSWQLARKWLGKARRTDPFAPDLSLPDGFFVVRPNDYKGVGFDRGHMCPAGDRSVSKEDMDATFAMSNMVPQSPELNRTTWEKLESYCRDVVHDSDQVLYIVAGPAGQGGTGSEGERTFLRARDGKITVPAKCWKVVLIVPAKTIHPRKVTAADARVFAVVLPNQPGARDWRDFAVPVKDVEELTGYKFFTNLNAGVADQLRTRKPETRARGKTAGPETKKEKPPKKVEGLELPKYEPGCIVANKKSKIYHDTDSTGYDKAKTSANAVFFKTAKDAEKAGYTRAKR